MANKEFWERVKTRIKEQKTTQKEVAIVAGINQETIKQQIHYGRLPDIEQGAKIAQFLHTSIEFLLTGEHPAGFSEPILKIAYAAEKLSPEGQKIALNQVRSLQELYPFANSASSKTGKS